MNDLKITLFQTGLYWHDPEANLASFEEKMWEMDEPSDLIILPEMFNTGFTMNTKRNAELINGRTFKWMKQMAGQQKSVITGSLIIWEKDHFYNRLIWMKPDGSFSYYDKKHLFSMAGETRYFTPGQSRLIEDLKGWKICPLICYDLRFPEWIRNRIAGSAGQPEYDLVIFVANWPAARIDAWDILLKARAVENACYVAGVNRIGKDGNEVIYNGHSMVLDPKGHSLLKTGESPSIQSVTLSYEYLDSYRKKFPVLQDSNNIIVN